MSNQNVIAHIEGLRTSLPHAFDGRMQLVQALGERIEQSDTAILSELAGIIHRHDQRSGDMVGLLSQIAERFGLVRGGPPPIELRGSPQAPVPVPLASNVTL